MLLTLARIVIKMILILAAALRLMLPRLHHTYYIKQREKISINMCC